MIFDLHQITIGNGLGEAQNFVVINPRMAGDYAVGFAGLEQNSWQRIVDCRHN
jgi:hypothetical protein